MGGIQSSAGCGGCSLNCGGNETDKNNLVVGDKTSVGSNNYSGRAGKNAIVQQKLNEYLEATAQNSKRSGVIVVNQDQKQKDQIHPMITANKYDGSGMGNSGYTQGNMPGNSYTTNNNNTQARMSNREFEKLKSKTSISANQFSQQPQGGNTVQGQQTKPLPPQLSLPSAPQQNDSSSQPLSQAGNPLQQKQSTKNEVPSIGGLLNIIFWPPRQKFSNIGLQNPLGSQLNGPTSNPPNNPIYKNSNNNVGGIFKHDSNLAESNVAPFNTPDLKNKQNGSPIPGSNQPAINRICDVVRSPKQNLNPMPYAPPAPNGMGLLDELIRRNDNVQHQPPQQEQQKNLQSTLPPDIYF